jgi:membrane protein YdbS with pleckstrin-like domain
VTRNAFETGPASGRLSSTSKPTTSTSSSIEADYHASPAPAHTWMIIVAGQVVVAHAPKVWRYKGCRYTSAR